MSLLFANTHGGGQSGALIDLKAGRCTIESGSSPNTRKVVPQPQKGTVFLKLTSDQLLHFCWKNRESGETQLDLIVFPGDTEFIRMKEATDGRVYMLKLKSSSDRHIFWMQESKADKDDELCKRVNELLNNPTSVSRSSAFRSPGSATAPGAPSAGGGSSSTATQLAALRSLGLTGADEMGALSSMDQNQLLQLLTLMGEGGGSGSPMSALTFGGAAKAAGKQGSGSKTTGNRVGVASSQGSANGGATAGAKNTVVDATTLSNIISSLSASSSSHPGIDLPSILSRANVQESVAANASSLLPHVPNQEPMSDVQKELSDTVGNPQFRQAAEFFGAALQTGKMSDALPHFGIKDGAVKAAQKGDFLEFAKELTQQESGDQPATSADEKKSLDEEGTVHETNESAIKKKGAGGDASNNSQKGQGDEGDNMDLD